MIGDGKNKSEIRGMVWKMFDRKCYLCGKFMARERVTIDHVIPKSAGGVDKINNFAPAHYKCNSKKASNFNQKHIDSVNRVHEKYGIKPIDITGIREFTPKKKVKNLVAIKEKVAKPKKYINTNDKRTSLKKERAEKNNQIVIEILKSLKGINPRLTTQ